MTVTENILKAIDAEIEKWAKLKASVHSIFSTAKHRKPAKPRKKRHMSAEARKRIGEAQRKRWAKQKKAAK